MVVNVAFTGSIPGIIFPSGTRSELTEDRECPMMIKGVYRTWVERISIAMIYGPGMIGIMGFTTASLYRR
jgi:hypothetical protein